MEKDFLDVLLFEDNTVDAKLVTRYLEQSRMGCDVVRVASLGDGVKLLRKAAFDVVLIDLSLPDSEGVETVRRIASLTSEEVIIVLTGTDDEALALQALKAGAQDYLFKDQLSSEALSRSIRYSMERANLLTRVELHNKETQMREDLLRRIFDANTDAMLILTDECEIRFLNPAAAELLDSTEESLMGEIFPFEVRGDEKAELEIPTGRGATRFVELRAVDLVWNGENSMLVVLHDITDFRTAEVALSREKHRLDVTIDGIADAVVATDSEGMVERLNAEASRLLGLAVGDVSGVNIREVLKLVDPVKRSPVKRVRHLLFESGRAHSAEGLQGFPLSCADGEERLVDIRVRTVQDGDGRHGHVIVFRDVTKLKQHEEELFMAEKMQSISQLAGGIAHDFNNMLTAVLGNISVVRMSLGSEHEEANRLESAEKAALQARTLTQQLLSFSKGGAPVIEATTIDQLVEDCAQFLLRGSNVRCEVEKDAELWAVDADKGQVGQVVNNLIINANQAMPDGGVIRLRLENASVRSNDITSLERGDYVCIAVADEGTGIPAENLNRIFDPYFTTKKDGNGLGLASCYSIIRNHKGVILVESVVGEGTEFKVYLPKSSHVSEASEAEPDLPEPAEVEMKASSGSPSGRVLVMDDMEAMMMVAGEILQLLGYEVVLTSDGTEAIDAYKVAKESGKPFDVVVFDLTVPGGMGGEQACAILREYDPGLKAIASSGYSTSNIMSDWKSSNFDAVVPKPYRIKEMGEAMEQLLG
ncbi:response regulator [Coraliomargarita akajimensis]|uniref:histidine kinase n=1 Tax=Coraliomargarita akajimensis (strain DSM 45221 / IAM 15411 / JCM 23193 / KCTC 12865 / 04OKA010-24) TaxID=583355 RepID=D5EKP2_CORAD|nr:response regulator [Coraliomargarita akajimensis]ADE54949.1 PAS/PAC sensor hybrid histidine kinase [Coraliomargarita akajimensis DSM 45221]